MGVMTVWYLVITLCAGLNCTIVQGPYPGYGECIRHRMAAVRIEPESSASFECRSWYPL